MHAAQMAKRKPSANDEARGKRLELARMAAGFARLVDVETRYSLPSTYRQYETGRRKLQIEDVVLWADRYKVDLQWLCTGKGEPAGLQNMIARAFMSADPKTQEIVGGILKVDLGRGDLERPPDKQRPPAYAPAQVETERVVTRREIRGAG